MGRICVSVQTSSGGTHADVCADFADTGLSGTALDTAALEALARAVTAAETRDHVELVPTSGRRTATLTLNDGFLGTSYFRTERHPLLNTNATVSRALSAPAPSRPRTSAANPNTNTLTPEQMTALNTVRDRATTLVDARTARERNTQSPYERRTHGHEAGLFESLVLSNETNSLPGLRELRVIAQYMRNPDHQFESNDQTALNSFLADTRPDSTVSRAIPTATENIHRRVEAWLDAAPAPTITNRTFADTDRDYVWVSPEGGQASDLWIIYPEPHNDRDRRGLTRHTRMAVEFHNFRRLVQMSQNIGSIQALQNITASDYSESRNHQWAQPDGNTAQLTPNEAGNLVYFLTHYGLQIHNGGSSAQTAKWSESTARQSFYIYYAMYTALTELGRRMPATAN